MSTGVEFRALRESRGMTIDRIATATRISVRMIEALERDDVQTLPPRPYLRGFVAAYSREVGLDPADAVARYFSDYEPPPPAPPAVVEPVTDPEGGTGRALLIAGFALALLLIVPALNRWHSKVDLPQLPVTGTSGSAPASATPSATATAAPAAPAATDQGTLVQGPGDLVVSLTFTRPCWLTATADGTRVAYRTMDAGATQILRAHKTIALRVGDAGAAAWIINGRAAAPMGRDGEVRSFLVTPDNSATIK